MSSFHGTFWRGFGPSVALATLAASPIARADDGLRFEGPAECPDVSQVRSAAAALLGRSPDELGEVDVDARVARLDEGGYRLALRTPEGERELVEASCGPLADATALIVALMIDPEAASGAVPEPEAASREPDAPLSDPRPRRRTRADRAALLGDPSAELPFATSAPGAPTLGFGAGIGLALDVGTLPFVTAGAMGEAIFRVEALDVRVRLAWLGEQGAALGEASPVGSSVTLGYVGGALLGCGRPFADFGLALCGGVHAGAIFGSAQGISDPRRGEAALAALSAGVMVPWQIVPELDAELVVPIAVPAFDVAPFGVAHQPAPVTGRFTLAVHVDVR